VTRGYKTNHHEGWYTSSGKGFTLWQDMQLQV